MPQSTRFRPNSPPVLHETLENEAILVNLEIGTYYSLNTSATGIWGAIDRGASVEEIVGSIVEQSGGETAAVEAGVRTFVDQLAAEQLVVPCDPSDTAGKVQVEWAEGVGFEPPVLSVYTDLQELLLLDPVHDVGAAGWPEPR